MTQVSISPAEPRTADTVTAAATGTDPSGLSLTYNYQWLRNGVAVLGATGASLDLGLAGAGDRGDQVTVRVRAFNGSSWSAPVTSSAVTVADTAPAIAVITDRTTVEGSAANLSVSASDVDGDSMSYTATGLPPGLALNVASGQVTGTPPLGSAGAYFVTIVVNDGSLTASRPFTWTVTAADLPPTAPTGLVARATTTSVALDWADATEVDVAGYRVYRATSASGPFTQLGGTLAASTSTDQAPLLGSAVYAVATVDLAGQESARTTVSVDRRVTLLGVSTATRASVKSLSVNRPANLLTNDVLLAVVVTPSSQIPTAPSGWTRVRTDVSGIAVRQSVYVRRVSASEPASYSWSVSGKDDISIAVLGYRGADGTVLPASGGSVTASSTSIPAASVATTAGYLLVSTFAVRGTASLTEPATYDARARLVSPTSRSTTLLVTDAVATTTGSTTLPQAVSAQATTGLGASMSWRVL